MNIFYIQLYIYIYIHTHHRENCVTCLLEGFIPFGLRVKKCPAFKPVSDTFEGEWNSILNDTKKD